jgi:hypothetical protein
MASPSFINPASHNSLARPLVGPFNESRRLQQRLQLFFQLAGAPFGVSIGVPPACKHWET